MKNRWLDRMATGWIYLCALLLVAGCSPKRVSIEGKPSPAEKKVVRKGVYHTVERHQTLYRICKTYRVDLHEVAALNGISDPSQIKVGQKIFIPGARKVLKVEIVIDDVVAEQPGAGAEGGKTVQKKIDFIWPVEGSLRDRFEDDERKRHQGIDISAPQGTPIKASASGTVIYSGNTVRGYGNMVILRHSEEYVTVYAHNLTNLVEEGEWIERGQIIGRVGQTGRASGPHLHFEIRRNNRPVNPLHYLR